MCPEFLNQEFRGAKFMFRNRDIVVIVVEKLHRRSGSVRSRRAGIVKVGFTIHDARNMAKALWVHAVSGEFGLPVGYKPQREIMEL